MQELLVKLKERLNDNLLSCELDRDEITLHVSADSIVSVCLILRDQFNFKQLMDVCGVDYSEYGGSSWETKASSGHGFSRAVEETSNTDRVIEGMRFAVVYHLLAVETNQRVRVKVRLEADSPVLDSVVSVWASADWFEREAFDMFGILFSGHPDLRRILTDYGFVGYPFRKDFPLIGNVEMRYDAEKKRVIYEPVSIEPRTLVPRVIRDDNRYYQESE